MTESISTPNALVQTNSGKRYYVYSGEVTVSSSDTKVIDIDNIGERDIKLNLELGVFDTTSADTTIKVNINDITIYSNKYDNAGSIYGANQPSYKFIIPSNSSLTVILTTASGTRTMTMAGHGKFV